MITLEKAVTGFSGLESLHTQSKGPLTRVNRVGVGRAGHEAGTGGVPAKLSGPAPGLGGRRAGRRAHPSRGLREPRQRFWSWDHPAELAEFGQRRGALVPLCGPVTAWLQGSRGTLGVIESVGTGHFPKGDSAVSCQAPPCLAGGG